MSHSLVYLRANNTKGVDIDLIMQSPFTPSVLSEVQALMSLRQQPSAQMASPGLRSSKLFTISSFYSIHSNSDF